MKAPAIAAAGMEERYRGCGHGKVEGGGRGGWPDKLHPLSTNDFVLFTNTFVPRLFILFLYRRPFFSFVPACILSLSSPAPLLSLFLVSSFSDHHASSSMNVSPLHSRRSHVPALNADTLMFHRAFQLSINKCACYLHTADSRKANIYTLDINTH